MRDPWTRGLVYVVLGLALAGGIVLGVQRGSVVGYVVAAVAAATAVGLWFERAWARYVAVTLFVLVAIGRGARAAREGGASRWISALGALWLAHSVWTEWRQRRELQGGIQVLCRKARPWSATVLAEAAKRAWPQTSPSAADITVVEMPKEVAAFGLQAFALMAPNGPLHLTAGSQPSEEARSRASSVTHVGEMRLQDAIANHTAWFTVDTIATEDPAQHATLQQDIAQLVAALLDADSVAMFSAPFGFALVGAGTAAALAVAPAAAFRLAPEPPVVPAPADDAALAAAAARAQATLGEFEAGFRAKRGDAEFFVKAPFAEREHVEHLWLRVTAIAGDAITGTVENQPVRLPRPQLGQVVRVARGEVSDWLVRSEAGQLGGFSLAALDQRRA